MKSHLSISLASLLVCVCALSTRCDSKHEPAQSPLVIAAIVEAIGKHPGATSVRFEIYQLAKYKVVTVCAGTYEQKEIVVDHLLISGDELMSLHAGDKVYLTLSTSKTLPTRSNEEGFRTPSQTVETFYIGGKPDVTAPAQCRE